MNELITAKKNISTFSPKSQADWRNWLIENYQSQSSIWLICYKKKTKIPSLSHSEAVDEALCFGWIDGVRKSIDNEKFMQFFCKRKARGTWSKVNKAKVIELINQGKMTNAGLDCINAAKKNGSWTILDEVEELKMPDDLIVALEANTNSKDFFLSLSKSSRKAILYWIVSAKRPETRQNRINETIELAAQKQKPKQF